LRSPIRILFTLGFAASLSWSGGALEEIDSESAKTSYTTLKDLESVFVDIADRLMPAVVNVETEQTISSGSEEMRRLHSLAPNIFRMFNIYTEGKGSGFIIDPSGIILTNHHVIAGADEVFVRLSNSMEYAAECFSDPHSEVAVIRIKADEPLPYIKLGDSNNVRVGQYSIAIGNPLGYPRTFSVGHITGKGRILARYLRRVFYQNFLQTDAAINLGNSGGPLVNLEGEVIGINTAIVQSASGMGFAIPINIAKDRMDQLLTKGYVSYGYLGVGPKDIDLAVAKAVYDLPDNRAVYIENIVPDSPAEKAGLRIKDIVLEVEGQSVENSNDLIQKIGAIAPGTSTSVTILRDKVEQEITLVIGERPHEILSLPSVQQDRVWGMTLERADREELSELGLEKAGGIRVKEVDPGTPAYRAGIRGGDIIYLVNGQNIPNERSLRRFQRNASPGEFVTIEGYRETETLWSQPRAHQTFWLKVGE